MAVQGFRAGHGPPQPPPVDPDVANMDPVVRDAVMYWRRAGNPEMAEYVKAANTPGATLPPPPPIAQAQINQNRSPEAAAFAAKVTPGQSAYDPTVNAAAPPPPTPPAPKPSGSPTDLSQGQQDALARIQGILQQYGLGELADWSRQAVIDGLTGDQLNLMLYDPTSVPGKVVDRIFPELQMQRKNPLLSGTAMSIAAAQEYRKNAIELMRAANIPAGFYDQPEDLARWSGNGVSLVELKDRVDEASALANSEPPETLDALNRLYGIDVGGVTARYLDETKALPLLHKQATAAITAGIAARSGYAPLNQTEAERLANLGVTRDQAQQGFTDLAAEAELFGRLPGEREKAIGRGEQLAAQFGGDANARRRIAQRAAARAARFAGGGGYSTSREGVSGIGSVAR